MTTFNAESPISYVFHQAWDKHRAAKKIYTVEVNKRINYIISCEEFLEAMFIFDAEEEIFDAARRL